MGTGWLVTGAQGFIGRYVSAYILHSQPDATVLGIGRSEYLKNSFTHSVSSPAGLTPAILPDAVRESLEGARFSYRRADVTSFADVAELIEAFRPDFILHLASGLRGDHIEKLIATNVGGTRVLFQAICGNRGKHPKVVIGSTAGVYGNAAVARRPLVESEPCLPADDYARTKLTAEGIARDSATGCEISVAIARIFNVIGPGQHERHVAGRIAAEFAVFRSGARRKIELGRLHCTRDFIDVRDVAQGLIIAALHGEGTLNLGSGCEYKIEELVSEFSRASGLDASQMLRTDIPAGVERSVADIARIRALGFVPAFSLRASIEDIWAYYDALWRAVI